MPALGAPEIQHGLGASYETTAWVLLLVPGVVALVLEPLIFLHADRQPRERFVVGGLLAMAVAAVVAALAPGAIVLSAAISISWVASGCAVGLAQVALVESHPGGRERAMTRWAMMGMLGDLGTPVLFAGLAMVGLGWRAAYAGVALVALGFALALARRALPAAAAGRDDDDDGPEPGTWTALRTALGNRTLLLWLLALWLCELLDEILVVFASLHLRDALGIGPVGRALVLGADLVGGVLGLLVLERLLRTIAPLRLLAATSLACVVSYGAWLLAADPWTSGLLMVAVGATSASLYPLAAAQAYATMPGRGAVVAAAGHLFTPFSLALPWALGALADHAGPRAALVALAAQPLGLLVIAVIAGRRTPPAITR